MSQRVLCARLGVSQPVLSRIERGEERPEPELLARIVQALHACELLPLYCRTCDVRHICRQCEQLATLSAMEWVADKLADDALALKGFCAAGDQDGFVERARQLRQALDSFLAGLERDVEG